MIGIIIIIIIIIIITIITIIIIRPIPVAERSKAWVFGLLLPGIVGSNPAGAWMCMSLVSVVCSQVEVCASG